MNCNDIQEIVIVYGKKDLIQEFLEIFQIDRAHDGAPLNAILLKKQDEKTQTKCLF